jgi:morphogenetic protein associated with SpoVID
VKIHIVKEGDTLYELSKKYDVPLAKIIDANPQLVDPNKLEVGTKIKVPTEPVPVPGGSQPIIHKHTVKQGDSLWKLSKAWGVTLKEIIDANPQLKNPNALLVGEVVNIPSSGVYTETGAEEGTSMSSGSTPGKKKPGSKEYTGVKEEITAPIEQPPVPEVKEPEPPVLPKLPEISPFPEEPKKIEPEIKKPEMMPEVKKPIIMPEIKKPEIMPEIKKPEIMPEIKKSEVMPEFKKPVVMPEFKPEFKPEFIPPYKPIEPEYTFPVKTMPLPHPIHPIAEPCPPFMEMPVHMMPHPCPEFPHKNAPAFTMPQYVSPEGPWGYHEPVKWQGADFGKAVHPFHQISQEVMPVSYNEGWGNATAGYPGVSEQPMSLEYSQFSITESYTGGMGSNYQPYPEHHHTAMTYGYVPSPCGCHGGEISPYYNMPHHGYPQHEHHGHHVPGVGVPYQPWQGGMDFNAGAYGSPAAHGTYPSFANPYEQNWNERQNEQQFAPSPFETQQSNISGSNELENADDDLPIRDTGVEEAAKSRAKVNRQQANKTRTAAKKSRKQSPASRSKRQNPWIKG